MDRIVNAREFRKNIGGENNQEPSIDLSLDTESIEVINQYEKVVSAKVDVGRVKRLMPLLEANAGGQKWEKVAADEDGAFQLQRLGAKAYSGLGDPLTVTLDEYADFVAAEKKRLMVEQADRVKDRLKDF